MVLTDKNIAPTNNTAALERNTKISLSSVASLKMKIPKSPPKNNAHCKIGSAMAYPIPQMAKREHALPTFHMIPDITSIMRPFNVNESNGSIFKIRAW